MSPEFGLLQLLISLDDRYVGDYMGKTKFVLFRRSNLWKTIVKVNCFGEKMEELINYSSVR